MFKSWGSASHLTGLLWMALIACLLIFFAYLVLAAAPSPVVLGGDIITAVLILMVLVFISR